MQWFYLLGLLAGISGMLIIDYRFKLAFWHDAKRTAATLLTAVLIFILWDFIGISLGIFFHNGSHYTLPIRLAPQFPLEEIFFLFLLCYSALVMYRGVSLWRSHM